MLRGRRSVAVLRSKGLHHASPCSCADNQFQLVLRSSTVSTWLQAYRGRFPLVCYHAHVVKLYLIASRFCRCNNGHRCAWSGNCISHGDWPQWWVLFPEQIAEFDAVGQTCCIDEENIWSEISQISVWVLLRCLSILSLDSHNATCLKESKNDVISSCVHVAVYRVCCWSWNVSRLV